MPKNTNTNIKTSRIISLIIMVIAIMIAGYTIYEVNKVDLEPKENRFATAFSLLSHTGQPITQAAFRDNISAVFFGFTHCPEICPTTLTDLAVMRDRLGANKDKLDIFFITIDPIRDNVDLLAEYIPYFGEGITGITGTEEDIYALVNSWGIYAQKTQIQQDDYSFDHTASVFLLDEMAMLKGTISYQESEEIAFAKLKRLTSNAGK